MRSALTRIQIRIFRDFCLEALPVRGFNARRTKHARVAGAQLRHSKPQKSSDYASSMPKRRPTRTKPAQLKSANFFDFRGFRRVLLFRVGPEIALITRRSSVQI